MLPVFRLVFVSSQPFLTSKDAYDRLQGIDRNNMDNEPLLLGALLAWGYLTNGNPAPYAVQLVFGFVATRYIHNFALIAKSEPLRTFAYLPAFIGTLVIGFMALSTANTK